MALKWTLALKTRSKTAQQGQYTLYDNMGEGVLLCSLEKGTVVYCNPAAQTFLAKGLVNNPKSGDNFDIEQPQD